MVITRKIEVYVCDEDLELRKAYVHDLYAWRDAVRRAANVIVAHKFVQNCIRDFVYIKDEIKEKFYVKDILKEGPGMSEMNTTYRVCSDMLKGEVPADIYSTLNNNVAAAFKETYSDVWKGKASVRSYKNNIPVPFTSKAIRHLTYNEDKKRYEYVIFGIPMACKLGADRSNNAIVLDRVISGEWKMCGSSYMIDDKKKKIFLLLCFDMPEKAYCPTPGKELLAELSVDVPILAHVCINAKQKRDSGHHTFEIGGKEEYLHRRIQIQAAVRRCQIANRYSTGGHGRKKKCKAIDHWHEKEKKYIDSKLHMYSRMLVDLATKHQCEKIILVDQKEKEYDAKEDEFLLRNWGYYGLKEKIRYKCKLAGVVLEVR